MVGIRQKNTERSIIMKETFLGKMRDLWTIRRRCQQINVQRSNRYSRSSKIYGGTRQFLKLYCPKALTLRSNRQAVSTCSLRAIVPESATGQTIRPLDHRCDIAQG